MPKPQGQQQNPQVPWGQSWYSDMISGKGPMGPDPAAWQQAQQAAVGQIAMQYGGMRNRLGAQAAASGDPNSGQALAGQRWAWQDQERASSAAMNQLAMQQATMAQQEKLARMQAAGGQAGLDVQRMGDAERAAVQQYLAELQGKTTTADIAAQSLDWVQYMRNQGYPVTLGGVGTYFQGSNPAYPWMQQQQTPW